MQQENNPSWDTSIPHRPLANLNGADILCNKVSEMHHNKHLKGAIDKWFLTICPMGPIGQSVDAYFVDGCFCRWDVSFVMLIL